MLRYIGGPLLTKCNTNAKCYTARAYVGLHKIHRALLYLLRSFKVFFYLKQSLCSDILARETHGTSLDDRLLSWLARSGQLDVVAIVRDLPRRTPHFRGYQWSSAAVVIQFSAGAHATHVDHPGRLVFNGSPSAELTRPLLESSICCQVNRRVLMLLYTACFIRTNCTVQCLIKTPNLLKVFFALATSTYNSFIMYLLGNILCVSLKLGLVVEPYM